MADNWQKADILGKILLGAAGFTLSGVLAVSGCQEKLRDRQDRADAVKTERSRQAETKIEQRETRLKEEFRAYYGFARGATNPAGGKADLDIASSLAQTLGAPPFSQSVYSEAVQSLQVRLISTESPAPPAQAQARAAIQSEVVDTRSKVPTTLTEWFAVVGTFAPTPQGLSDAERLVAEAQSLGCAQIWKTKVSNNYAVVLGGKVSRGEALANAASARARGLARDAFTQVNREWSQVRGC